ncbi:MAG: uL30 family ribosomal protein [Nanoarchaeota archaeon]|nr:uL30 family ribosomal protein [Nanoarchaeota archaeon]
MAEKKFICIVRIRGQVGLRKDFEETFERLRTKRKYACNVLPATKENLGMIKKVRNFIAFGPLKNDVLEKLIEKRGQPIDKGKKIDAKKATEEFLKGTKLEELNLKPFFRLHPARGGIKTKFGYPKGVLGDNKEDINKLVERML